MNAHKAFFYGFLLYFVISTIGCEEYKIRENTKNGSSVKIAIPLKAELGVPRKQFVSYAGLDAIDSQKFGFRLVDDRFTEVNFDVDGCCEVWQLPGEFTLIVSYGIRANGEIHDFVVSYRIADRTGNLIEQDSL